jgi:lysyl-tRNA synthetase class 1
MEGLSAYAQGDFVKAIHVLVPQVEHILRIFFGHLGIPTRKTVRNKPGITDVKNMNEILGDARMQEKLTENLWRYLTLVYIDRKGGLNLRNDLAHGLVSPDSFNKHVADLVFHTLLALSLMRAPKKSEGA